LELLVTELGERAYRLYQSGDALTAE
jgi:hypothetical protein